MTTLVNLRCAELDSATRLLRARERSLQHLAQSTHCSSRSEAEMELGRVRAEIAAAYAQMRQLQTNA